MAMAGNQEEVTGEETPETAAWPDSMSNMMPPTWFTPVCANAQMLPTWSDAEEQEEHVPAILRFRTEPCPDFQRGHCTRHGGKGKGSRCFGYHFETQMRRCPVDPMTGQLTYWEVPCEAMNSEMNFCPNGNACLFAHGRDEVSYHPAKYKTRPCNGHECRGEGVCCFAHSEAELRHWAPERYSYFTVAAAMWGMDPQGQGGASGAGADGTGRRQNGQVPYFGTPYQGAQQKHRFCATFPNVSLCRRGASCAFAHSREEARTPLLTVEEEEHQASALTEEFFTQKFKTLWCPIGAQHDWQACAYAHTYQDARRKPSIGYGPQPCPYWGKKDTRAAYSQRCPLGLRCPYSHGAKEQLYHPLYFRTVICRDLQLRGCPRQHLCAFHHRRSERRSPGLDTLDYSKPLDKEAIPPDWASSFLAPPFFQETGESEEAMQRSAAAAAGGMGFPTMMAPGCGGMFYPSSFNMGCPAPQQVHGKERRDEETPRTQSTVFDGDGAAAADSSATSSRDDVQGAQQQQQQPLQMQQAGAACGSMWQPGGKCEDGSYADADSMAWAGAPCFGPCYTAQPAFFYAGPGGPGIAIPVQAVWWTPEQQQQMQQQQMQQQPQALES